MGPAYIEDQVRRAFLLVDGGAPGRDRTYDLGIRSPLLYPLSYERMSSDRLPLATEDPLVGSQIDALRTAFIAVRHKRVPLVRGVFRSGWRQDHASGRSSPLVVDRSHGLLQHRHGVADVA